MLEKVNEFLKKSFKDFDLAIDLGTTNTRGYLKGKGLVLAEPSIVALDKSGDVLAAGHTAKEMLGSTHGGIVAIRPLKYGVIADFGAIQAMLRHFIDMIRNNHQHLIAPRIVVAVPPGFTQIEKKAVREAAEQAGASEVYLIEEPLAAAIGTDRPVAEPSANILVDIGGGTTKVGVISQTRIIYSKTIRVAGDTMDDAIGDYLHKKYNLLIGKPTAELIKQKIGTASPSDQLDTLEVTGRDVATDLPKMMVINSEEIRKALVEPIDAIVETVRTALEHTPKELADDVADRGIILTGGGAKLRRLDVLLKKETGLPIVIVADHFSGGIGACGPLAS